MGQKTASTNRVRLTPRLLLVAIIAIFGLTSAMTTVTREHVESMATALSAIWRGGGNSILFLDSNIKDGVSVTVDFTGVEPYPVNANNDPSFYARSRINQAMGGAATLESFKLLCGLDSTQNEQQRITYLVFWSQNYWEGTKQQFQCGGTSGGNFEITGSLMPTASFCLVTNKTPATRRSRCLNGPRCDDNRLNGNESDVDCGGSCSRCGVDRRCNSNSDCVSGSCRSGTCRAPSCSDGVRNGSETDVDCGGSCNDCVNGRHCNSNSDCQSNYCQSGVCKARPTCKGTPATSAAQNYAVLVENVQQCGGYATYFANSLSDAKSCAQADGLTPVGKICGYYVLIETGPDWTAYIEASTASHAVNCAKNTLCASCSPQVVQTLDCVNQ